MKVRRFPTNPIICPHMDERMGANINGPSLIRVPDWIENPLGAYYLYFGHHKGKYIRLAYADSLGGPWKMYTAGTIQLEESYCNGHIASPDVHIDNANQEMRMYYHGPVSGKDQISRVAISKDGVQFVCYPEILGVSYFRVFEWDDDYYALGMPGKFYRSKDGFTNFVEGPTRFTRNMRHTAVKVQGDTLSVFYSNAFDCPERIMCAEIELKGDWSEWQETTPVTVLAPETEYEGTDLPLVPSERGWAPQRVRQTRDPGIFQEAGKTYLLYSVAGEYGIGIAELIA